jgi:hypothetical protein
MKLSGAVLFKKRRKTTVLLSKPYPLIENEFTLAASDTQISKMFTFENPVDDLKGTSASVVGMTMPTVIFYTNYTSYLEDELRGSSTSVTAMTMPTVIFYTNYTQPTEDLLEGTTTSVTAMTMPTVISYTNYTQPLDDNLRGASTSITGMTLG